MQLPRPYVLGEQLDRFLGNPMDPNAPFSFQRSMELDESETYPQELIDVLNAWGVSGYHVPAVHGGKLQSLEELLMIARLLARRDLTVAIANGVSFLGALPVWLGGSPAQIARAREILLSGQKLGFAVTEKEHGHDILSNDVKAVKYAGGFLLSGDKWAWGNATQCTAFTLHARTASEGGARGFSVFFVDKPALDPTTFENTSKLKLLGLRGHDLSGISFHETSISADAMMWTEGAGVDGITKSLQFTRTMCGGLAMGAADTALRTTMNFARSRRLFGATVADIPHARSVLVDAFLDLLICDCVTSAAARAWHQVTDQMSVGSAIVKYLVPVFMENAIHNLSVVLGARFFMREAHCFGIFQKQLRDMSIISVFEGNTTTQLNIIGIQLRQLLKGVRRAADEQLGSELSTIFSLHQPIGGFIDPTELDFHTHGRNTVLEGLGLALVSLQSLGESDGVPSRVLDEIMELARTLSDSLQALSDLVITNRPFADKSPEQIELARRYATLHAAACCIHMWLHNRRALGDFFAQGEWLVLSLTKLLRNHAPSQGFVNPDYVQRTFQELSRLYEEERLFAIVPIQLAQSSNNA